ncbi:MAG: hypothetical protein EXS16_16440 [Gemmataceae bacterium]|nr:hypothetical protein [Gemmataceae bacterium]
MALFQGKYVRTVRLDDGVVGLVLDHPASADNALDLAMLDDIERALDALANDGYRLLILQSGKRGVFCTGSSFARCKDWTPEQFQRWCERGQQVCRKLAESALISVAVIGGTCHDEGLELALACDYRVALDQDAVEFGFPAQNWGMLPCWGGTFRLPRRIGLAASLSAWMYGDRFTAEDAWVADLVDEIMDDFNSEPPSFLESPRKRDLTTFPTQTWRQRWLENTRPGRWFMMRGYERMLRTRIPDATPNFPLLIERLRETYALQPIEACEAGERSALAKVVASPMMRHLLRLLNRRERLRERVPLKAGAKKARKVGILGTGDTAIIIVMKCVVLDYEIALQARDEAGLGAVVMRIAEYFSQTVQAQTMTMADSKKMMNRIKATVAWKHFGDVDILFDTTEGEEAERIAIYQQAIKHLPARAVIAPMHPTCEVAAAAKAVGQPARIVGVRAHEPWDIGTLVEIVPATVTVSDSAQRVRDFATSIGFSCLNVADRVGGLTLRVWLPCFNEVGVLIREGVRIADIDAAMICFGMKKGPCEWMDRYGLDRIANAIRDLQPVFGERIRFETGFTLMAMRGWRGEFAEQGFFRRGGLRLRPNLECQRLWQTQSQGEPALPIPVLSRDELYALIRDRLVTLTVLEAQRCLAERIVDDADDLDCAISLTGWATHRGGPLGYAADIGVEAFAKRCRELAAKHGPRYLPIGEQRS